MVFLRELILVVLVLVDASYCSRMYRNMIIPTLPTTVTHAKAVSDNQPVETCNEPLGMQSGKIRADQVHGGSMYNNQHRFTNARLNKTSYPPGFLSGAYSCPDPSNSLNYLYVEFDRKTVVTGIATQGYGDKIMATWVESFSLMGSVEGEMRDPFIYKPVKFKANSDSDTIVYNRIKEPKEVKSIFIIPNECHGGKTGLRVEFYGCVIQKTYILWVRRISQKFDIELFGAKTFAFKQLEQSIKSKVERLISSHKGFLFVNVLRLSPGSVIVHLEVGAVEAEAESLLETARIALQNASLGLDPSYFFVQDPQGTKDCKPPRVNLNLPTDVKHPAIATKSQHFTVKSTIDVHVGAKCKVNTTLTWKWSWSRLPEGEKYFEPRQEIVQDAGKNTLVLSKHMLQYGTYYIEQHVGLSDSRFFTRQYGFLKVVRAPLQGYISGPKVVAKGYSKSVTINVSSSYDPDFPQNATYGMAFQWSCVQVKRDPSKPLIGCFGTGQTNLTTQKGPVLELPVNKMIPNYEYNITVVITKDSRSTTLSHVVKVDQDAKMVVQIKCKQNCGEYDPNDSIVVEATCSGIICQEKPTYVWTVIEKRVTNGNVSWQHISIPFDQSSSQFNVSRIKIPKETLKVGVRYMLKVTASSKTENVESNFTLNSNEAPVGGKCYVDHLVGEAFTTVFNFTCEGWKDDEPPLTYKFHYMNSIGVEVLLQYGSSPIVVTKLPVGFADKDYNIPIEIFIADSVGVGREIKINIKSKPWLNTLPTSSGKDKVSPIVVENSTLYHYTVGSNSRLSVLLKNNNIKQATNLANEVLSMMSNNAVQNISSEDKMKIKDNMISQMAKVKVTDMKNLIQVSSVVAGATEEKTELSQKSKDTSVKVLESMADVFSKIPVDVKKGSSDMMSEASTNLIHGMGNVLDTFSYSAAIETGKTEEEMAAANTTAAESKKQNKEAIHKVLDLIGKVSDALLATKTPGDKVSKVKTNKIEMVVQRESAADLGNQGLDGDGGGVKFPSSKALFGGNGSGLTHVDTQMLVLKNNPYTWDKSAKNVKSSVLSVDLKSSGKKIAVEGLQEEIELVIKNPDNQPPPSTLKSFSKPSIDGSMRYHTTNVTGKDKAMHVTVNPEDGKLLEVYVGKTTRPTIQNYSYMAIVPDLSKCPNNTVCPASFLVAVPANLTKEEGLYYVGIKQPEVRKEPVKSRTRRSCSESGRKKRSVVCVEFKDPPTTPAPTPQTLIPSYDPTTDVNYTISIAVKSCLYWSETTQNWTNYGCRVSTKVINGSIVCLCNHLSSFGGDFFVAPNPIDFDQVWLAMKNIGESQNFVVLSTLCTMFALYAIVVILARKEDKNDELKITRAIPVSRMSDTSHCYEITVSTGIWRRCGTTSNIAMKLCGEDGESGTVSLSYSAMCDKQLFGRGSVNVFIYASEESLGDLNHIRIWHDNFGDHPAWFLRQVVIRHIQTDTKWHFVCNKWLALEKGDGKIDRILYVSTEKEINGFRNKFCSRAATGLGDGHLWLSVVTRPPASPFTRVQRATCCLCVLLTAMVANAMFYQFGEESKDSFKLGPLIVSVKQIIIGIQSSIIIVPINLLIVFFFKNTKPKDDKDTQTNATNAKDQNNKKKSGLPHFFVYVAWFLAISASLTSAAFTFFYSMMWGREKSNQWLTSILVSFSQDIIFIQPIKVLIVATLLAFIIKKAPEDQSEKQEIDQNKNKTSEKEYSKIAGEVKEPQSPKNEDMETFRQYRVRVLKMARTLIELCFYLTFVWMLMVICYGSRDVGRYWMTHGINDMLIKFDKVKNADGFWKWAKTYMVPGLYSVDWYNGQPFEYKEGFVSNKAGYLVGMPRLRQVRAAVDDCPIKYLYPNFSSTLNLCIPPYSFKAESKTSYNLPGWFPLKNNTRFFSEYELLKMCPRPWRYKTATTLHNLPFQGENELYGGGGYVADLGYTNRSAYRVLKNLEKNSWIDERTRAVFLEVLIFEPSSSLFSAVTYLFEKPSMGGALTYVSVKTMSLYGARSYGLQSLYAICELTIILIVIYFVIAELIKLYRQRCSYFKMAWNWIEITQILASIATIVLSIFRRYHATQLVNKVHANPFMTSSFHYVVMWSEVENALMAILIFVITMKLLRILKFNQQINVLARSMSKCGKKLVSYSAVFLVAFLAFAQVAILAFGSSVQSYSSIVQVFRSQFSMFVGGDADYYELQKANAILGPFYFFAYMTAMATILINMFLAILNEAYREVHVFRNIEPEEHKMMSVFIDYANGRIKKGMSSMKDAKLFPQSSKYEVNDHLLSYEEIEQKYTPLEDPVKNEKRFEDDPEDKMLASVKGCFQALRYDLRHLISTRKRTYKVQKASKKDHKQNKSDFGKCQCQGVKYNFKAMSTSFQNITDEIFRNGSVKKSQKEDKERLLISQDSFDAIEETALIDSDSEGEVFLENSLFFGKKKKDDRETII